MTVPTLPVRLRRGVTLVEVMVVVVIIGILSGLAVPKFIQITGENQLDGDVHTFYQELLWARTYTIKTGDTCRAVFSTVTVNGTPRVQLQINKVDIATGTLTAIRAPMISGVSVKIGLPQGLSTPSSSDIPLLTNMGSESGGYQAVNTSVAQYTSSSTACRNTSTSSFKWNDGIQICGGTLGEVEPGVVYLSSSRSDSRAYAIVFDKTKSLTFANLRYMGSWEKM